MRHIPVFNTTQLYEISHAAQNGSQPPINLHSKILPFRTATWIERRVFSSRHCETNIFRFMPCLLIRCNYAIYRTRNAVMQRARNHWNSSKIRKFLQRRRRITRARVKMTSLRARQTNHRAITMNALYNGFWYTMATVHVSRFQFKLAKFTTMPKNMFCHILCVRRAS